MKNQKRQPSTQNTHIINDISSELADVIICIPSRFQSLLLFWVKIFTKGSDKSKSYEIGNF